MTPRHVPVPVPGARLAADRRRRYGPGAGGPLSSLLLLVVCFLVGVVARRRPGVPADGWRVLNFWVVNVSLPALVLSAVHGVALNAELLYAAAGLWAVFAGSAGLAVLAARRGGLDRSAAGAWALCAGLGNTAFVGLPAIEALGGADAARTSTLVDQLGSFAALSLLAVPFAAAWSGGRVTPGAVVRRLVSFPPFQALVLALLLRPVAFPGAVEAVLARLAAMMSPLALASVGWQLEPGGWRGRERALLSGLLYKQVAAPAVVLGVLLATGGARGPLLAIAVTQASMPPMVTAGVLAAEHGFDRALSTALIAGGLVAALVTVPGWWAIATALGGAG